MMVLNHGFTIVTLLLFLALFFADDAWARSLPWNARSTGPDAGVAPATLVKRAASDAYYQTCYDKGLTLTCASEMSDSMAYIYFNSRSVVATALTQADLTASGWTVDPEPWMALEEKFEQYVGEEILTELGLDPANNAVVNWVHSVAIDSTHPATGANYQCWYNVPAGAIIVDLAWSPSYKVKEMSDEQWPSGSQFPAIQQLSDVMWIEWAAQATAGGADASSLKYIFQMDIVNLNTRAVIERAMGGVPAKEWVGYTDFETTSEAGYALLGTPNGNPQTWILINHKDALGADQTDPNEITGLKKISKIRIWTNKALCYIEDLGDGPCYHMLFFIDTVSEPDFMDY